MNILRFFLLPLLVGAAGFKWTQGGNLPSKLSDFTSTLHSNGKVYIAGGCQSNNGHAFFERLGIFRCDSTTNSFFSYDPETGAVDTSLANMPRKRYRHAAAISRNRLYIIGGREAGDGFHPWIDVYNFDDNTWDTFGQLTPIQAASDLGAFTHNNDIYLVGGYDGSYKAKDSVWKIDTSRFASKTISISAAPSMQEARADIRVHYDGSKAYVVGGYTHENDYCPALNTGESWTPGSGQWTKLRDLSVGRANTALTSLRNELIAVGGESPAVEDCQVFFPQPGMNTDVLDSVEILSNSYAWTTGPAALARRYRFGDTVMSNSKAYFFGGLNEYRADCQCYKTTNEVWILSWDDSTPMPVTGPTNSPTPPPTPPPIPRSTNKPTLATDIGSTPGPGFGCFAGETTVHVMNKGTVSMKDLTIGDHVKVAGDKFSQVYSFGHYEQQAEVEYLSIDTGLEKPLLITPDHMLFVNGKAIPASLVSIGDTLSQANGSSLSVESIKAVIRGGAFAPFTMDGTIVVNDVVASSFVALVQDSPSLVIGGVETLSLHGLAYLFEAPHRLVCALSFGVCSNESYSKEGLSAWIEAPLGFSQWILEQAAYVQVTFFVPALVMFAGVAMVEAVVTHPMLLLVALASMFVFKRKSDKGKV